MAIYILKVNLNHLLGHDIDCSDIALKFYFI